MYNIYLKSNEDWLNKLKYGYVLGGHNNLVNRLRDSIDEHSELSIFTAIYQFEKTAKYDLPYKQIDKIFSILANNETEINSVEKKQRIKLPLLKSLNNYLVKSKSKLTNEFIKSSGIPLLKRIIKEEFPLLGLTLVKEYTISELDGINTETRERVHQHENDSIESYRDHNFDSNCDTSSESSENKETYNWLERDYQKEIISYAIDYLLNKKRIYIELATGGGKSYIIYKIISQLMPMAVVVFSPRININQQNTCDKYLSILNHQYLVYNCSLNTDFSDFRKRCIRQNKKMLIVACSQGSHKKVSGFITDYGINDVFIWFDEAHNTIEKWVDKADSETSVKYLLEDTESIKHRVFTSASPDKKHVEKHPQIFGELYSPIKVKELIDLGWLCQIVPHIFSINKSNVDICNYNISHFNKFKCNYGFSFHNLRDSAFNLFKQHYELYKNGGTSVKPFLLVGSDYQNPELENTRLNYDFRSIECYEQSKNSMGYVVQQYSMGYDFKEIDYIIFSDPKMCYADIIQCIGRGIRPDGLGEIGKNLLKKLSVMLPVYIESELDTNFNRIEGVLRYLVYDIEYNFEDIDMDFSYSGGEKTKLKEKYDGKENMKAILLDLLRGGKYSTWKPKDFTTLMKNNNIHDRENAYSAFIEKRPELNLPEDPYRCFPDFTWVQTYTESPYYSKEECKQKIAQIKENDEDLDLDEEDEPEVYLNSIDPKIPPQCLFRFYGGNNSNEYY